MSSVPVGKNVNMLSEVVARPWDFHCVAHFKICEHHQRGYGFQPFAGKEPSCLACGRPGVMSSINVALGLTISAGHTVGQKGFITLGPVAATTGKAQPHPRGFSLNTILAICHDGLAGEEARMR